MSKDVTRPRSESAADKQDLESYLEEFSIMELEDRLELTDRCNGNCDCKPPAIEN